ncbi:MAG: hypothetical protein M0Z59_07785 [Nitrospiraceae bacterium]|nr:hypothetical protein [Nitrospiraceae bacterium]
MLVLWLTIPMLAIVLSVAPLLAYFAFFHRVRGAIRHPFIEGITVGLLCWGAFAYYLLNKHTGEERFAAVGICIAMFFGFVFAGTLMAVFYKKARNRLSISLFPGRADNSGAV